MYTKKLLIILGFACAILGAGYCWRSAQQDTMPPSKGTTNSGTGPTIGSSISKSGDGNKSQASPPSPSLTEPPPDSVGARSFALYNELVRCSAAEATLSSIQAQLKEGKISEADAEAMLKKPDLQASNCATTANSNKSPYELLDIAAASGVLKAQIRYVYSGSPIVDHPELGLTHPEMAIEYRTKSVAYLTAASTRCDPQALVLLSNIYGDGTLAAPDPIQAATYSYVLSTKTPSKIFSDLNRKRMENLTDTQIQSVTKSGDGFFRKYCQ